MIARSGYIELAGLPCYLQARGAGEPLLLLHGGLEAAGMLPELASALAERFLVIEPERRGHGRTPHTDVPLSYELMVADTVAVLDALEIPRVPVIGFSDGAIVGLQLALAHPERCEQLVLVGGNVDPSGLEPRFARKLRDLAPERFDERAIEAYAQLSPDGAAHWSVVVEQVRRLWLDEPQLTSAQLGAVTVPVLLLAGDRDIVTPEHTVAMYRAFPDARLCILPGSHDVLTEQPELTSRVILEFLAG